MVHSTVTSLHLWEGKEQLFDPDWSPDNKKYDKYLNKLNKIKTNIDEVYYREFLYNITKQATDKKDRYIKKQVGQLKIGDLVAIIIPNCKRAKYPMGIIVNTIKNENNEITEASVRRASGEIIDYHVTNLIPVLVT